MKRILTPVVITLGFVSLLTDISSEMLIPIMPVYLTSIGYSALWIGILEGVAEAVAGIGKAYFGNMSDRLGKRAPFVQGGYFLSSLSKPLIALFINPLWVLTCRVTDRIGKGVRTGARDAILSAESEEQHRAKVFGFHRGMDTMGATLGALVALLYLIRFPGDYRHLFMLAFIPAIAGVFLTFVLKDSPKTEKNIRLKPGLKASFRFWNDSSSDYKKLVTGLLMFTLFNSSDVFLLLKMKHSGMSDQNILLIYIFYNLVYALFSYPAGRIADRVGVRPTFLWGLILFIIVYGGMAFCVDIQSFIILFFIYGIYAALTEGISKAWITLTVKKDEVASGIGLLTGMSSILTLLASTLAGLLWSGYSPSITFIFSSLGCLFALGYFMLVVKSPAKTIIG